MSDRTLEIGDRVVYHDPEGRPQDALVTAMHDATTQEGVWTTQMPYAGDAPSGEEEYEAWKKAQDFDRIRNHEHGPLINVVAVSLDTHKTDSYGRQVERSTSVPHKSDGVHGYYWRWPDEAPNPVRPSQT